MESHAEDTMVVLKGNCLKGNGIQLKHNMNL